MANLRAKRFAAAVDAYAKRPDVREKLTLGGPGTNALPGWFMGPKAENHELFTELILGAIQRHVSFRQRFHPEDPAVITEQVMATPAYQDTVNAMRSHTKNLLEQLEQSVPFFSMRYQGHMLWDMTLPGAVGYFAGMLYNQNNVAVEASPVTTVLEMEVGNDLCRMLGYTVPADDSAETTDGITPWGHITCDGSVANLEALWAARNLKFFPITLKAVLTTEPAFVGAKGLQVTTLNGSQATLINLDTWTLLNLKADDVLRLTGDLVAKFDISLDQQTSALARHSVQNLGFTEFHRRYLQDVPMAPVGLNPVTKHYSWPKGAAILGIGANNMLDVFVDLEARMEPQHLRQQLQECLDQRRPVLTVVTVIGTTEESAVDPLEAVLAIREEFRMKGLDFTVHADAAWGGYFATMIREEQPEPGRRKAIVPTMPMSKYVTDQYYALAQADSITVDPHKAGFIPYPAGGLCYRNSAMRNLVSFTAPVIYHNETDPTVGIYGVEGSKPGAAAAAVYLSHRVIRPDKTGYGKILGECMFTAKKLYARLVTMTDPRFTITMFHMLPTQKAGEGPEQVKAQLAFIQERITDRTNEQLIADAEAMALFRQLGSDQVILPYVFNFFDQEGRLNRDVAKLNDLNQRLFEILSVKPGEDVNTKDLIVTSSSFDPNVYGKAFMDAFQSRIGVDENAASPITFLLSTVMDPWTTETPNGSFLPVIAEALRKAVHQALDQMVV